ncbi:MAG: peptidylprolyl isomerase [Gammaproteobacteria bacterium]
MHVKLHFLALLALVAASPALAATSASASVSAQTAPRVQIETSMGNIVVQLDPAHAPITVKNFLGYVRSGFYAGTIFHRVIPGFMIQGGGYTATYQEKPTRAPIKDEANNGLPNTRGTIAMARQQAPDTAKSQFYINLVDNASLDYASPTQPGYAVFGHVISGMDVVDKIAQVPTGPAGPFMQDAPQAPVIIQKIVLLKQ